jgi:hypothetical protein
MINFPRHGTHLQQGLALIIAPMTKPSLQQSRFFSIALLTTALLSFVFLTACSDDKSGKESKFLPVPDKTQADKKTDVHKTEHFSGSGCTIRESVSC